MNLQQKATRFVLGLLVSGLILAAVLSLLDTEEAWSRLLGAHGNWLLVSLVVSFAVLVARGSRFAALTTSASFGHVIAGIGVQNFLLRITPLRLGELSLPYFLQRSAGERLSQTLVSLLLVRLVELWVVLVLAGVASAMWFGIGDQQQTVTIAIVGVGLVSVLLVTLRQWLRWLFGFLHGMARRTGADRNYRINHLLEQLGEIAHMGAHLGRRALMGLGMYTLVVVALQYVLFWCLLRAFGLDLEPTQVIIGASAAQVAGALPLATVGNIGAHETGWTVGFLSVGVSMSDAALTGVATQILTLLFSGVFALPAWFYHRALVRHAIGKSQSGAT